MEVHNPHDKFFRSQFSRPEILKAFLEKALPPGVSEILELHCLQIMDGTHIDPEYREHFSDVAALVQCEGRPLRIYILIEHKSFHDPLALLQILRYQVQTWIREAKDPPSLPLTPILPILFYHGSKPEVFGSFSQLFPADRPKELIPFLVDYQALVYNLTAWDSSHLEGPPELSAVLWVLKYTRTQVELALKALERLAESLGEVFWENPDWRELQLYLYQGSNLTPEEFLDKINQAVRNTLLKEKAMSTYDQILEKGKTEGKLEGKLEGQLEGKILGQAEAAQQIARNLKALGLNSSQISQATGLSPEDIQGL